MKPIRTAVLASIRGGDDPIEPVPIVRKCQASSDTCKSLYNAASGCFSTWRQPSACPQSMNCIKSGGICTYQTVLKRCIGVPVEACNEGAVAVNCGRIKIADMPVAHDRVERRRGLGQGIGVVLQVATYARTVAEVVTHGGGVADQRPVGKHLHGT